MPNRVTSSRTLHAQRHAHPADRSNLTQTHHYHERLQRGNHVHASEGGARDPGASTTRIRSRRDGVETEEVSVRAARSGATLSGVSETSLHQEQRTHSHATRHTLYRRCCGKIQYVITCRPDLMHPRKRAWQTSQQSAGRRHEMSQPPAEIHMAMVRRVTRDWKRVRGSTDYRLGLDRMSPDAEVHVLWHHPMARGDHQLAREDGVSARAVKPRNRVPGGSATCLRDALRSRACESSASSAIAMATRRGLERPRHLKVKWPGLQQLVNAGRIRIVSVKGMENLPDVGTKFVVKAALDTRRKGLGLTRIGNGVAVILTNPTHMGAATLMMLISGVSAEPQDAQTCCIIWTVLTVWTLLSVTAAIVIDKAFTRPTMLKHQR